MQALKWQMERDPATVRAEREQMITQIENANARMWQSGLRDQWFAGCDDGVKRVCEGVNGHLMHELLVAFKYHDAECVELLRQGVSLVVCLHVECAIALLKGAPMIGELEASGIGELIERAAGTKHESKACKSVEELKACKASSNTTLVAELREDSHAEDILRATRRSV